MSDIEFTERDVERLKFIYGRLADVFKENRQLDYMIGLRETIDKVEKSVSNLSTKDMKEKELKKRVEGLVNTGWTFYGEFNADKAVNAIVEFLRYNTNLIEG